jgi:ElaA protein
METQLKEFNELTINELYGLLALRSEVFVVEQDCVYQDIDQKDQKALHVLGYYQGKLVAYARCFKPSDYFNEAAIGRVVVDYQYRKNNYGHQIMDAAVKAVYAAWGKGPIKLSAQTYLIAFYEQHGFKATGDTYLEDGIPHIAMVKP